MLCFVLCFFKQKTAYEMRISDWSSDVCSSDLGGLWLAVIMIPAGAPRWRTAKSVTGVGRRRGSKRTAKPAPARAAAVSSAKSRLTWQASRPTTTGPRSEERRAEKECGSAVRARWSPSHHKKTKNNADRSTTAQRKIRHKTHTRTKQQ